jgi:nitrogen fixation/metabolism regulation signal transduction histidine kinase
VESESGEQTEQKGEQFWRNVMPSGIRPKVNEAREFLEIAKDFKDAKEIMREALSNSWDAKADRVSVKFDLMRRPGTNRKKIVVEVTDNGDGMSTER